MIDSGVGRLDANFDRESSGLTIPIRIERDRQEIRQRRLEPTALTEGLLSSKRQQSAAAHSHKVSQHAVLFRGEDARIGRPEYDALICEELLARGWKTRPQVGRSIDVDSQVLAVCRPLYDDEAQVRFILGSACDELHLGSWQTLEIQDLCRRTLACGLRRLNRSKLRATHPDHGEHHPEHDECARIRHTKPPMGRAANRTIVSLVGGQINSRPLWRGGATVCEPRRHSRRSAIRSDTPAYVDRLSPRLHQ